jgi:hypothetical protein
VSAVLLDSKAINVYAAEVSSRLAGELMGQWAKWGDVMPAAE